MSPATVLQPLREAANQTDRAVGDRGAVAERHSQQPERGLDHHRWGLFERFELVRGQGEFDETGEAVVVLVADGTE